MEKRHYLNTKIAGFSYYQGAEAFEHLKVGLQLELKREEENRFDPYAVAVYYKEFKLGFIPRESNHDLSKLLEMGWTNIFEVRINRISLHEYPENQIGIVIHLFENEANTNSKENPSTKEA